MNESKVLLLTNLVGFFSQLIEKKYCYNKRFLALNVTLNLAAVK